MGTDGSKQPNKAPVIPPRDLLVQKFTESRAPELKSLYSTIANRLNNNFKSRRNKRRRTTSFDNRSSKTRSRKKQKIGVSNQESDENAEKCVKKAPPRHIRRRKELNKNPQSGFCTSGDGTKRLRTHVWHAKRFTMTKRWGFHLPLGLHGRGRGSRALLKWLKNGTVVHDASYYCAVQLEGSQGSLLAILSNVMAPFSSLDAGNVLSGGIYASSMLHHSGAPILGPIAPVIYMWRPTQKPTDADVESDGTIRQLWIWIHAAALTEGYNALKSACESQGKINEDVALVSCTLLEGQLGTIEVMGSKASQLLQRILYPVSSVSEKSSVLRQCTFEVADDGTRLTTTSVLENEEHISSSGIISFTVGDPRALTKEGSKTELISSYADLWDASKGLCCPFEESVLCNEKHHKRLSSFCLTDKSSDGVHASTNMHSSRFCPVLLLRRNNLKDSIERWSIILPLSWVKAFWVPLVSNGAQAIGLRERSWVACEISEAYKSEIRLKLEEAGIPSFPSEFPECGSYSSLMDAKASAIDKEASLRPLSVRPFSIPIPPPWNCVCLAFGTNPTEAENTKVSSSEPDPVAEPLADSNMVVARTSRMLAGFLNAINGDHLLLFAHLLDKNTCVFKIMRDEKILESGVSTASLLANRCRKLCFVRVILHAYKEGVIEDGAVVCAPRLADMKLWLSGSNNKVELQVPQSSMTTYFVKQDSGKWEFQVPEDPAAMESNRWPIGFVTTGFIRGSKKPSAGALCDAVLLAHLRHEQWSSVPPNRRKKEIYVLTRNLRSSAYRLALATIVLEQQQEDLDHI